MRSTRAGSRTKCSVLLILTFSVVLLLKRKKNHFESSSEKIVFSRNLLEVNADDFVTGERVSRISDIGLFTAEYIERFPHVEKLVKSIVLVGEVPSREHVHQRGEWIFYYNDSRTKYVINRISTARVFLTKAEHIEYFAKTVVPHIRKTFVVFTHFSDEKAGHAHELLQNSRLLKWYGCNMNPHPKTMGIPLGLENVEMWKRTNFELVLKARQNKKTKLLYVLFDVKSNTNVRAKTKHVLNRNGFPQQTRVDWPTYIGELSRYKFCASPEGNGVDTHRMWECLYLGVVPIVVKDPMLMYWFSMLPILWVDSFEGVTSKLLRDVELSGPIETSMNTASSSALFTMSSIERSVHDLLAHEN